MSKDYHCCATCRHFVITRQDGNAKARCSRLGYETKTYYKFDCWDPRDDIRAKMSEAEQRRGVHGGHSDTQS